MKIRQGFVSNSSSSSYIVIGKEPTECRCVKLNTKQIEAVINYIENRKYDKHDVEWSTGQDVFLTPFLSDGGDICYEIPRKYKAYEYCFGSHGGPYNEEDFDELDEPAEEDYRYYHAVWIMKEHNLEEE